MGNTTKLIGYLCLAAAITVIMPPRWAVAPIGPSRDLQLRRAHKAAEVIFAGRATAKKLGQRASVMERGRPIGGTWESYDFQVDHVILGQVAKGSVRLRCFTPQTTRRRGSWLRVMPYAGDSFDRLPIGSRCLILAAPDPTAKGAFRLARHAGSIINLANGPGSARQGVQGLSDELLATVEKGPSRISYGALQALLTFGLIDADVQKRLRALVNQVDRKKGVDLLTALIRSADPVALKTAIRMTADGEISARGQKLLGWAISEVTQEQMLPEVKAAARSPSAQIRAGAIRALRFRGGKDAIPILGAALSESDIDTVYHAFLGLGRLTRDDNRPRAPSKELFLKDPAMYIPSWLEWWEQNKHKFE